MVWTVKPADRLKTIKPSGIRRFFALAQKMPGCINLTIGEPDFCPPQHAIKAGWQAASEGKTHYAPTNGIPDLRAGLAEKAYCDYGLSYDPNCEILVTAGGTEAIFVALLGLLNSGDEVLIPNPGFVAVYEQELKEPIGLSTVATYLSRMATKGLVLKAGSSSNLKYKASLNTSQATIKQKV